MKKVYLIILFAAVLMISGCKKSESTSNESNSLKGMWSSEAYQPQWLLEYSSRASIRDDVYEFINDNTVICYGHACNVNNPNLVFHTPVPGHSGWYYEFTINYSYVFQNNKVVLTNGEMFSYINGKLYKDNSSIIMSRW